MLLKYPLLFDKHQPFHWRCRSSQSGLWNTDMAADCGEVFPVKLQAPGEFMTSSREITYLCCFIQKPLRIQMRWNWSCVWISVSTHFLQKIQIIRLQKGAASLKKKMKYGLLCVHTVCSACRVSDCVWLWRSRCSCFIVWTGLSAFPVELTAEPSRYLS